MQNKWYEKCYRRTLLDMHIEDWNEAFMSEYDPDKYVKLLKLANVQSVMIYANSHVGYCYYPSKIGLMHRGLKGRDVLGEMIGLCRKEGIFVTVYYSLIFNNWAYENNTSWRIRDINGKGSREVAANGLIPDPRKGLCCPNSEGYREFVVSQIEEICKGYDFDGFFFDMTFWPVICHCESCKKRFESEIGGEMPEVIDWDDKRWVDFQNRREKWLTEFAAFATETVIKYKPEVSVEHNSAALTINWRYGTTFDLVFLNDYIGGDLYGGFTEQSFICKLYNSITPNKPFEYMTSRCFPNLADHTTLKPKKMLEMQMYLTLAHNGAFMFIDAIDPAGSINPNVYEMMGDIYGNARLYEPYIGGKLCSDVAVYFNMDSKMDLSDNGKTINESNSMKEFMPTHTKAAIGAVKILKENHIPFNVISENNLTDIYIYKVLILPDIKVLNDKEAKAVKRFVEKGGSIYVSGYICSEIISDMLGITKEEMTQEAVTYIAPCETERKIFSGIDKKYPLCMNKKQWKVNITRPCDVLAKIVLPYTNPADGSKFSSIHSNPPGVYTEYPAVISRKLGNGKIIWVSAPIETVSYNPHANVFINMIKLLADNKFLYYVNAPDKVEVLVFHQEKNKRYLINIVNEQDTVTPVKIYDIEIVLQFKNINILKVISLPGNIQVPYKTDADKNNRIIIHINELDMFRMIAVEYS